MKYSTSKNQSGFGYLSIVIGIVVVIAVASVGWWVWQKNQDKGDNAVDTAVQNAKCNYDDEDLCKFFTGWKAQKYYTLTSVSEADGKKTTTVMKIDGEKSYLKLDGALTYEVITIGGTTYTKAGDTWWKQTTPNETAQQYQQGAKVDLKEPASGATAETKTTYKKLGKEKCGDFTCFKYQVVDPASAETTSYVWFDDDEYQLRRTQTVSGGTTFDATYSYDKTGVSVPSPVKDLGPNQYIVPGQAEPVTLPTAGDGTPTEEEMQQLLQQYGH